MQAPYVPAADAPYALWLANLAALITATPTAYGLLIGDATIIQAAADDFAAKYALAINPTTRTSATIADKDASRASATATVRPYCVQVSLNPAVSDALKVGLGVNLPNSGRTPVPPPATAPTLAHVASNPGVAQIGYADSTTPASKAKPPGVIGMEVRVAVGTVPAIDPDQATYVQTVTKSPFSLTFAPAQVGKIATLFTRWVTRSGPAGVAQNGPWSAPLSFGVI